ncbi:hypothetical protein EDF56_104243 [Novosphingobium sp. PhB165]|nr:hypothetical protein EDF56_104243 [Novosphingobium sp. PhB165]
MPAGQSAATPTGHKGKVEHRRDAQMIRLLPAIAAVAASSSLAYGIAPGAHQTVRTAQHVAAQPVVLGNDKPVFLGRMVVTATPLSQ